MVPTQFRVFRLGYRHCPVALTSVEEENENGPQDILYFHPDSMIAVWVFSPFCCLSCRKSKLLPIKANQER
jgi:hypothetical protein